MSYMQTITMPSPWTVTLNEGSRLTVWATAYAIEGDEYVFDTLVQAPLSEQERLDVSARTPADSERIMVIVARIPVAIVATVYSAD
jgi:hypothetical protein